MAWTSQQSTWNPDRMRCEFCDCFTNNDLELSEHISSEMHLKNRREFVDHHINRNVPSEKKVPLSLMDTLKALKLKSNQNVADLAKKGFFQIKASEKAAIANDFSRVLMKAIVQYESRHLSPELRQQFLDLFQYDNTEEQEDELDEVIEFDEISDLDEGDDVLQLPTHEVKEEQLIDEPTPTQSSNGNLVEKIESPPSRSKGPEPDPHSTYKPILALWPVKQEPIDD